MIDKNLPQGCGRHLTKEEEERVKEKHPCSTIFRLRNDYNYTKQTSEYKLYHGTEYDNLVPSRIKL